MLCSVRYSLLTFRIQRLVMQCSLVSPLQLRERSWPWCQRIPSFCHQILCVPLIRHRSDLRTGLSLRLEGYGFCKATEVVQIWRIVSCHADQNLPNICESVSSRKSSVTLTTVVLRPSLVLRGRLSWALNWGLGELNSPRGAPGSVEFGFTVVGNNDASKWCRSQCCRSITSTRRVESWRCCIDDFRAIFQFRVLISTSVRRGSCQATPAPVVQLPPRDPVAYAASAERK